MTSEERREARRKRRQEKRARAKAARTKSCTLANVASMDSLVSASRRAARGVMWKHSVQRYMAYYLLNAARTRDDMLAGRDVRRGFTRFDVVERGKVRHISAPRISERVAQKSLTRNVLTPALVPTATYSNAANIEGRGTEYSIRLMKRHLAANWRKRGRDGYILLMDDAGYFDSLLHGCAKRLVANAVPDAGAVALAGLFVNAHGGRGLGLGSEPDQVLAVCYQNGIDHYIAEMLGVDAFGRYMDDSYCIHESKEYLQVCLMLIERKCAEIGLTLHPTKTRMAQEEVLLFRDRPRGREAVPGCRNPRAAQAEAHGRALPQGRAEVRGCREQLPKLARKHEASGCARYGALHGCPVQVFVSR